MPSWVTAKACAPSAAKATATGRKPTDTPKVGSGLPAVALASEMNVRSWKPWLALAFMTRRASVQAMAQLPSRETAIEFAPSGMLGACSGCTTPPVPTRITVASFDSVFSTITASSVALGIAAM